MQKKRKKKNKKDLIKKLGKNGKLFLPRAFYLKLKLWNSQIKTQNLLTEAYECRTKCYKQNLWMIFKVNDQEVFGVNDETLNLSLVSCFRLLDNPQSVVFEQSRVSTNGCHNPRFF